VDSPDRQSGSIHAGLSIQHFGGKFVNHKPSFYKIPLVILGILFSLSCSFFSSTTPPPAVTATQTSIIPTPQEEVKTESGDIQIDYVYTSNLITIIYPLYGSILDDFSVVTLTNSMSTPTKVVVASEVSGYTDQAIDTIILESGETLEVRQNPRLIPGVIDQLNVEKPAQFHLRISRLEQGEEKLLLDDTGDTLVYARRDFPWSIPGFSDQEVYELLAAMVTPNDPSVEELLRSAADYTDSGIIWGGYGDHLDDDDGGVWDRLQAIWRAEDEVYDLTYVNTDISFAPGTVQRIRLPGEVLEQRSGNCIETSLLYASAAEALDLEAAIILIPGHAYVGVRTDDQNANYYFIETTLIGRASFDEAVEAGKENFAEAQPHMEAGEDWYAWVNVWEAREKGIFPLPWH
jgi:hypothetical protein